MSGFLTAREDIPQGQPKGLSSGGSQRDDSADGGRACPGGTDGDSIPVSHCDIVISRPDSNVYIVCISYLDSSPSRVDYLGMHEAAYGTSTHPPQCTGARLSRFQSNFYSSCSFLCLIPRLIRLIRESKPS